MCLLPAGSPFSSCPADRIWITGAGEASSCPTQPRQSEIRVMSVAVGTCPSAAFVNWSAQAVRERVSEYDMISLAAAADADADASESRTDAAGTLTSVATTADAAIAVCLSLAADACAADVASPVAGL